MGGMIQAGDAQFWVERRGEEPDVLLIGGLRDTAEAWQLQLDGLADRYRLTAFDNRGAGPPPPPPGLRHPGGGPPAVPRRPALARHDGRRSRRAAARARGARGSRRR